MDKKNWIIIALTVIIIGLLVFIFTGRGSAQIALESLRDERDTAVESNRIMAIENERIREESEGLKRDNLEAEQQNNEYKQLIDDIRTVTRETKGIVGEYGDINKDFAKFLRSAVITD